MQVTFRTLYKYYEVSFQKTHLEINWIMYISPVQDLAAEFMGTIFDESTYLSTALYTSLVRTASYVADG